MRALKISTLAAMAAAGTLIATSLHAQDRSLDTFSKYVNPGKIKNEAGFENADINVVGALLIVQGTVKDPNDPSLAQPAIRVIEYTSDARKSIVTLGYSLGKGSPVATATPSEQSETGKYRLFAAPLQSPSTCRGSPDEPVLALGEESGYDIKWCNFAQPINYSDSAKKNYYYHFSNGDYALVATVEFDCDDPNDRANMPPVVVEGACDAS